MRASYVQRDPRSPKSRSAAAIRTEGDPGEEIQSHYRSNAKSSGTNRSVVEQDFTRYEAPNQNMDQRHRYVWTDDALVVSRGGQMDLYSPPSWVGR